MVKSSTLSFSFVDVDDIAFGVLEPHRPKIRIVHSVYVTVKTHTRYVVVFKTHTFILQILYDRIQTCDVKARRRSLVGAGI